MKKKYNYALILLSIGLVFLGCATHWAKDRNFISSSIEKKTGSKPGPESKGLFFQLPANVLINDGIDEDEAVAIALWNNAQFQADLLQLGIARADLITAGMIKNPAFSLLFPIGPKQLEWSLNLPAELIWQRPNRVSMAKLNVEMVAENLVQNGLGLVRDVLMGYAGLVQAEQQAEIYEEEVKLQDEIVTIAESRLKVGDISEVEATAIHLEAARTKENLIRSANETELRLLSLKQLLGLILEDTEISLSPAEYQTDKEMSLDSLLATAYATRPDLRAAELSIEAAGKRLGWERSKIFMLTAVLDANAEGKEGYEMGPGLQTEIPLFNWNQGGRSRADAQLEQASKLYLAKKQQIALQVRTAYSNYTASRHILALLKNVTISNAQKASENAEKAYMLGDISYLELLEFRRQLLNARLREVEADANLKRTQAELLFSIGFDPWSVK